MDKIYQYIRLLLRWNDKINLINCKDLPDLFINHVIDSLSILEFFPDTKFNICDIGPGAGFPGIILSIIRPSSHYTFLEPSKKYFLFLKKAIDELKLEHVTLIHEKVEEYSLHSKSHFNFLLSRAVGDIDKLFLNSQKLMDEKCILFLYKSANIFNEIKSINKSLINMRFHLIKKIKILETYSKNHYIIGVQNGGCFT